MVHPLPLENWLAYHIQAKAWLRSQFPAGARRAWRNWRAGALLLAALLAGASALWFWRSAWFSAPSDPQTPLSLPALSPIPDLTPTRELPPGSAGVPPLPATLTPGVPPAAAPLKELAPPPHDP